MKVYLATDHAGFQLKEKVKAFLLEKKYEVEDCGAHSFEKSDDWADLIPKAAEKVSSFPENKAIVFGGSGQGEMILANKFPNVRAVLFYSPKVPTQAIDAKGTRSTDPYEILRLTRIHNDANVLSLGARFLTDEEALTAVEVWLSTQYPAEERHARRIKKLEELEKNLHE